MFGMGDSSIREKGFIPFITSLLLTSGTASRALSIGIDPKTPKVLKGSGGSREYSPNELQVSIATDLTPVKIEINMPIKRELLLVSSGSGAWTVTVYYQFIKGNWAPTTEVLERLSDRKKMDRQDSLDDATEGSFRMGDIIQMGSRDPSP